MLLTKTNKRALRRMKGENVMQYKEMARAIGIHPNTLSRIIKDDNDEVVKDGTYQKIMQYITENV